MLDTMRLTARTEASSMTGEEEEESGEGDESTEGQWWAMGAMTGPETTMENGNGTNGEGNGSPQGSADDTNQGSLGPGKRS